MKLNCPVAACPNMRPDHHAMCRPCWKKVPVDLARPVYKAWRERLRGYPGAQLAHQQAVEDATAFVDGREPVELKNPRDPDA